MDWMKIAAAVGLVAMILILLPRTREMLKHSPKGSAADWKAFVIPMVGVVLFVMFLIWMVRG